MTAFVLTFVGLTKVKTKAVMSQVTDCKPIELYSVITSLSILSLAPLQCYIDFLALRDRGYGRADAVRFEGYIVVGWAQLLRLRAIVKREAPSW
jgi:hypothetical protein